MPVTDCYVDTSVLIKLYVAEPHADAVDLQSECSGTIYLLDSITPRNRRKPAALQPQTKLWPKLRPSSV